MAVIEKDGLYQYIDEYGNIYILYPVTKLDNVSGTGKLVHLENGTTLQTLDGTNIALVTAADLEALSNTANAETRVEYVDNVLKTLGGTEIVTGNAKIATGSYVGVGKSGSSNPCVLTFDFEPKFLQIYAVGHSNRVYDSYALTIKMPALTTAYKPYMYITNETGTSQFYAKKSADGKVVYFYYEYAKDYFYRQFNEANVNYYYVAIG